MCCDDHTARACKNVLLALDRDEARFVQVQLLQPMVGQMVPLLGSNMPEAAFKGG